MLTHPSIKGKLPELGRKKKVSVWKMARNIMIRHVLLLCNQTKAPSLNYMLTGGVFVCKHQRVILSQEWLILPPTRPIVRKNGCQFIKHSFILPHLKQPCASEINPAFIQAIFSFVEGVLENCVVLWKSLPPNYFVPMSSYST